jgi:hypothetical protein
VDQKTTPTAAGDDEIAVAIVIRRASDPIAGTIMLPDALPLPFTGWMQLTQLLARALDPAC